MGTALPPSVFGLACHGRGDVPRLVIREPFYCCDSVVTPNGSLGRLSPPRKLPLTITVLVPVLPSLGIRLPYLRCFRPLLPLALVFWSIPLCAKPGLWIETNACATPQTSRVVARGTPSHAPIGRVSLTLLKVNRDPLVTPW